MILFQFLEIQNRESPETLRNVTSILELKSDLKRESSRRVGRVHGAP